MKYTVLIVMFITNLIVGGMLMAETKPQHASSGIACLDEACTILRKVEQFRSEPYMPTKNDVPTIGYGFTDKSLIRKGKLTVKEADAVLLRKVVNIHNKLIVEIPVYSDLTATQKAVLISFRYNIGDGNFLSSTLVKKLLEYKLDEVPKQLIRWRYQKKKVLPGLERRRKVEIAMWMGKTTPDTFTW